MRARDLLDPDLVQVADALPAIDFSDLGAMRALLSTPRPQRAQYDGVTVSELEAPGIDGAPGVPIRLFRPEGAGGALPVLVAMHGGGFVLGDSHDFDYFCAPAARRLGIAVANVEYRLSPETVYPGPLDDCMAALRHLHETGEAIGIDATRIAVGGSSAGGGLAAGLALRARDEGGPQIMMQLLLSPALDDRETTSSMTDLIDPPVLAASTRGLVWRYYLGEKYDAEPTTEVSPYAVPFRSADLTGLPPAYIAAMGVDPLRDANIEYASRLMQADVPVELHVHPGAFHGSVELAPEAASSARILDGLIDALDRGLHRS